jgi:hypothetical protein
MPYIIELVRQITNMVPEKPRRYALGNISLTTPVKRTAHIQTSRKKNNTARFCEKARLNEPLTNPAKVFPVLMIDIIYRVPAIRNAVDKQLL